MPDPLPPRPRPIPPLEGGATVLAAAVLAAACAGPLTIPSGSFDPEPQDTFTVVPASAPEEAVVVVRGDTAAPAPDAPPTATDAAGPARIPAVLPGLDVLLEEGSAALRGRRVGLITNHTGVSALRRTGEAPASGIDLLYEHPDVELVALFSPEHGLQGRAEAGERVASGRDPRTGLPIHSLYGQATRPTPEMLRGVEALVFDIQDIGTRYYTYVWTMALAMQAAADAGIPFVVLDRPDPIGGALVQGNVLEPQHATLVGLYPVPMRHGLTAGELARLLVGEHGIAVELTVIPARGWRRSLWWDETGLPWVPPSPNMPSLESAAHYPGTCLFEGTNLSVGRGTDRAFQQLGAPWLDHTALVREVAALELPGVRLDTVTFTPRSPGDGKYPDQAVRGVRLEVTDRERYDPTRTAVALLVAVRGLHPGLLEWRQAHFDRLAGTTELRRRVAAGASLEEATADWPAQLTAFESLRRPYLLYDQGPRPRP